MYDLYQTGNTLPVGTGFRLPKHKGILLSSNTVNGAAFYFLNDQGNTFLAGLSFAAGFEILPIQVWSVHTLGSGQTAYRLN